MKKLMIVSLVLSLILCSPGALASPEDMNGQVLPDFSIETINGSVFTLSESLKTHDLVLINFWATWCGPCCMEFPFLETAWEMYSDRVDVIALSIEETDSFDVLRDFASNYGLNFMIGRDDLGLFNNMDGNAIPTTLIVDKNRRIVAVEIGCKSSSDEFTNLFDELLALPTSQNQSISNRCVLCFRDAFGNPVPGVIVAFCNGEYTPVETDSNGYVSFDGDPKEYHFHLLNVPNGYSKPWEELHISGEEYDLIVTLPSI
ncbi:MAG: redoxin family protein [Lachnospiraceae bacterium]|nr:redoxin family protein [Lachnospiraceae bacterium]